MNCPEELTLWELVQGSLSADELARVDTHLDSCPECRDVVGVLASAERVRVPAGKQRGDTLGRFTLGEAIGEGAMGAVFLARDPQLSRDVALKVLHPETATERGQARLLREARAMAQLSHPHVIRVYEVGQQDETVYLVMEPAAENLREWLARHPSQADILRVFGEAAMGLQAAHEAGVIHRDFKPENVLLSRQGVAQVADFGLAADAPRLADAEPHAPAGPSAEERDLSRPPLAPLAQASLTRTGALLGTPAYMAPERLSGAPATPLSDQFSFCVSLWEALEGARPFQATSLFELLESMHAGPPPATTMPRHVEGALRRGMRPAPGQRYPTMTALMSALHTSARQRRRGRVALALSAAGLVLLGGGAALRAGFARTPDADPCSQDGRITRVWNAAARTRLRASRERDASDAARELVVASLSRWAATWSEERARLCALPGGDRVARLEDQLACLDAQTYEVDGLLATLEPGGASGHNAEAFPAALESLPDPQRCAAQASLAALDPATSASARALEGELAETRARLHSGRSGSLIEEAEALVARAEALDNARELGPLRAHAQLLLAQALRHAAQPEGAEAAARASLFAAERAEAPRERAEAWLELLAIAGAEGDFEAAAQHAEHAEHALERVTSQALRETLWHRRGVVRTQLGDYRGAQADLEAALRSRQARLGTRSASLASIHTSLGHVARVQGRLDAALERHTLALALDRVYGEEHPRVAHHLHNLGGVLRLQGRTEDAQQHYERALAIRRAALGDAHPDVGLSLNSLGLVRADLGDWGGAAERWREAAELLAAAGHADAALAQHNIARAALETGAPAEALLHAQRAQWLNQQRLGPDAPAFASTLVTEARALAALSRRDEAREQASRALGIARTNDDRDLLEAAQALLDSLGTPHAPRAPRARSGARRMPDAARERPLPSSEAPSPSLQDTPPLPRRVEGTYGGGQTWD